MSTVIDSLSIEIESNSSSASTQIDKLASSLNSLKSSSKVTNVVNNLNKLKAAISGLSVSSIGLASLNQLATSLTSLSGIKAGGLGTVLNNLKKLPSVLKSLDTATLNELTLKMKQLASALAPLTNQLNKMGTAFNKLPQSLKKINSTLGTYGAKMKESSSANTRTKSTFDGLSTVLVGLTYLYHQATEAISNWVNEAKELDGIANRFGQAMAGNAETAYNRVTELTGALGINEQTFMQYAGLFGSLSKGFGVTQDKIQGLSLALTEMAYDIYAYSNDMYSMEEAMNAVRSAITGEIEPIRNAGISITQAMLQQTALNHGITQSVANMTESQKVLLRTATMIEQLDAQGAIGTYARELNTAEGALRALKEQVRSFGQAMGTLFLPIIQAVLPWISAFVSLITKAITGVAKLLGYEAPTNDWSKYSSSIAAGATGAEETAEGLEDAAAAAKKLKSYTLGFDELNIISPETPSSSKVGGADIGSATDLPINIGEIWDDALLKGANSQVTELQNKLESFFVTLKNKFIDPLKVIDINPLTDSLKHLWDALVPFAGAIGQGLYWFYLNCLVPLAKWTIEDVLPTFINTLASALEFITPYLYKFGDWVVANKDNIATMIPIIGAFAGAFLIAQSIGFDKISKGFTSIGTAIGLLTGKGKLLDKFGAIFPTASKLIGDFAKKAVTDVGGVCLLFNSSGGGLAGVLSIVQTAFSGVATAVGGVLSTLAPLAIAVTAIASVVYVLWQNWDLVVSIFKDFIEKIDLKGKFDGILQALSPLAEKFAGLKDLLNVIGTVILTVLQPVFAILAGLFDAAISAIEPAITIFGGFLDILSAIGEFIVGVFTLDMGKMKEACSDAINGVVELFGGLLDLVTEPLKGFVEGVTGWFGTLWDNITGIFNKDKFKGQAEQAVNGFDEGLKGIGGVAEKAATAVPTAFANRLQIHSPSKVMQNQVGAYIMPGVAQGITSTTSVAVEAINNAVQMLVTTWRTKLKSTGAYSVVYYDEGVKMLKGLTNGLKSMMAALKAQLTELLNAVQTTMNSAASAARSAASSIESSVARARAALEELSSMSGRSINVDVSSSVRRYATGGELEDGLFTMNHGEIAGKFDNGRSVVANNQQITEGIYQAVLSALRDGGMGQDTNPTIDLTVNLSGKQITAEVERCQKERGATIYKGGVINGI